MKKLAWLFMFISLATAGAIKIDVDQLRSPDHTKVWTPPAATATLVGKDTTDNFTNKTHDKLVITTSQVDTTTTGANAVFPTPTSSMFNFNNASLTSVDGITAPASVLVVIFRNKTGNTVTINNETGVNTTFRIVTGTGAAISLANNASLIVSYSTNYSRWYVTGGSGSGGGGLSSWITSHTYLTGDVVIESSFIYSAASGHTSGTFATDLAGGKWTLLSPNADLTSNQTIAGTKTFSSTIVGSVNGNAATVTTNANLTGPITSSGNTTSVASQTGTGSTFVMSAAPIITGHPTVEGVLSSGATGTGKFVFDTSPTLVTPTLGVATATSINSTTIPTSKTLIVNTDNLGSLGATTSAQLAGVISDETGSGALVFGTAPQFTTSVAIGGAANANAALDVQSTTQVSMPLPRMTTAQKVAIASGAPTEGSFAYDSTLHAPSFFDGTSWQIGLGTITVDSDWTDYTPTMTNFGTLSPSTNFCKYKRSGGDLEVLCGVTSGSMASALASMTLPTGLTIDSTRVPTANTTSAAGTRIGNYSGTSAYNTGAVVTATGTSTSLVYFGSSISNAAGLVPANANLIGSSSVAYSLYFKVPISGWSSNASTFSATNANYSYTNGGVITIGAITTPPTKGTIVTDRIMYQRNGQNLDALYQFDQSAVGSAGSGDYLFTLPNGLTFDSNVIFFYTGANAILGANAKAFVGSGRSTANATEGISATLVAYDATRFRVIISDATPSSKFMSSTWYALSNAVVGLGLHLQAPISNWPNVSSIMANISQIADVAILTDVKANNTDCGTSVSATQNVRNLNTLIDPNGIVKNPAAFTGTGGTNTDITLGAGTYVIDATGAVISSDAHRLRLRNTTDSTNAALGDAGNQIIAASTQGTGVLKGMFTIAGTKTFQLQHYTQSGRATNGLGVKVASGDPEVCASMTIRRIK